LRNSTIGAAVFGFLPLVWASLVFGWGLSGVWSGMVALMVIRLVAVVLRTRSEAWAVPGATGRAGADVGTPERAGADAGGPERVGAAAGTTERAGADAGSAPGADRGERLGQDRSP